jgi:type II secretory pathway pseudopilin PulG
VPAVPADVRDEKGFGLIELLFAMVMLNIGILTLVAAFNAGALALRRSATSSNGTAVADKVMEVYRDLKSDAIYLYAPNGEAPDSTPFTCSTAKADSGTPSMPNGIPSSTSSWYTQYKANTSAFAGTYGGTAYTAYYSYTTPLTNSPQWVTDCTTNSSSDAPIPNTVPGDIPSGLSIDPRKAVQQVAGPDGQNYTVFTYIVMVQVPSGGYVKQVTVYVYDPQNSTRVLAIEQSLFDPAAAP